VGKENVVTKGEMHDLAREFGEKLGEVAARTTDAVTRMHSLALCFDVLVTVLGKETEVKAELARRKAEMEAHEPQRTCTCPGPAGTPHDEGCPSQ
jgi:hypothetical protein